MEPLRLLLMLSLVAFGAYTEYQANEYLRVSKLRIQETTLKQTTSGPGVSNNADDQIDVFKKM